MDFIVKVENLKKWFPVRRSLYDVIKRRKLWVHAVDGVTFEIKKGEIFTLAGESGCGKTTLGKTILRLYEPTAGKIIFDGKDITHLKRQELRPFRRRMQIIYQDPYESLNPRMTVYDIVAEPLRINRITYDPEEEKELVRKALEEVELIPPEAFFMRFPHELSGGQRQRVAIARAIVMRPEFIVADEPVSMLDVSIRAGVLELLLNLREELGLTYLFITHDLAVAYNISDRIAIMYVGKIVELGSVDKVVENALHPYTKALISAVPVPDPTLKKKREILKGEPPNPINPPPGCRFHPRCKYAMDICRKEEPELKDMGGGHYVACHLY